MTLRLIAAIIGAAALPLITVTLPASVAVWPSPALAEETRPVAQTPYSELDNRAIRKRIRALRKAIRAGSLSRYERKQARVRIRAYRAELRARRQAYTGVPQPAKKVKPEAESSPPPPAAKSRTPEAESSQPPPGPKGGNLPEAESGEQGPAATGGDMPKTDGSEPAAVNVSEADCKDVWNEANKNGDDVLADDEAAPFAGALKTGVSATGASEPTIRQAEFMDACMKGAFKDLM